MIEVITTFTVVLMFVLFMYWRALEKIRELREALGACHRMLEGCVEWGALKDLPEEKRELVKRLLERKR